MKRLVFSILLMTGCADESVVQPTPVIININNSNTSTNNNNNGPVSPQPSPGTGSTNATPPATVKVRFFFDAVQVCPDGTRTTVQDRTIKVGCHAPITCTPQKADGTDYWADRPNQVVPPQQFGPLQNAERVSFSVHNDGDGYNHEVTCKTAGVVPYGCTVNGVTSLGSGDSFAITCN